MHCSINIQHELVNTLQVPKEGCLAAQVTETQALKPRVPHSDCSDEELVHLAQSGDTEAFGKLVQRHLSICLARALLLLRNRGDAEDEVQNAFSKALENLHQFRFEGPFAAWLYRIVQTQCLMLIRERRQVGLVYVDATSELSARLELVDQFPDQEEAIGDEQVDSLLHREISRIPPLMRNVILLRDVEGLPIPEVAARLGVSVPAAKSRLTRARQEMRSRIAKHCGKSGPRTLIYKAAHTKAEYTYT